MSRFVYDGGKYLFAVNAKTTVYEETDSYIYFFYEAREITDTERNLMLIQRLILEGIRFSAFNEGETLIIPINENMDFLIECNYIIGNIAYFSVSVTDKTGVILLNCTHRYDGRESVRRRTYVEIDRTTNEIASNEDVFGMTFSLNGKQYYTFVNGRFGFQGNGYWYKQPVPIPEPSDQPSSYQEIYQVLYANEIEFEYIPLPDDTTDTGGTAPTEGTSTGGGSNKGTQYGLTVSLPPVPTASALTSGFVSAYKMSISALYDLYGWLWSDNFDLEQFKKIFSQPIDLITNLSILPFSVSAGSADNIYFGNIDSGISANRIWTQYQTLSCGTVSLQPFWDAYLDCSPHTKIELYLPYIGSIEINPDDILMLSGGSLSGGQLNVTYYVDVLNGACCAFVSVNGSKIGEYCGSCSTSIPVSGVSYEGVYRGLLSAGMSALGMVGSVATGNAIGAVSSGAGVATSLMSSKPSYLHGGNSNAISGYLGSQKPYLVITRPQQSLPVDYGAYYGYRSNITETLSNLVGKGFTKIGSIHLQGIDCTTDEADEIERLLKEGVVL